MELVPLSKAEIEGRDVIDAAFKIDESVPVQGSAQRTALTVIVRNPHSNVGRIDLDVDGDEIVENHTVQRDDQVTLGVIDFEAGERRLAVRWMTPAAFAFVEVACTLSHEEQELVIDAWHPMYPPRLLLDEVWLNRPPGLRYRQSVPIEEIAMPSAPLLVMHDSFGRLDSPTLRKLHDRAAIGDAERALGVRLDVWIDGKRPCPPRPTPLHHFGPVVHRQSLSPGLHHVRIADRLRHRILVDTDVVCNGADRIGIRISDASGEDTRVAIRSGTTTLNQQQVGDVGFVEGLTVQHDLFREFEVDGHTLPAGLESWLDMLRDKREIARRIRENYRRFLELRRSAERKRDAGEALTEEEQAVADITDSEGVHDWVTERKRAEGLELRVAATTGADGTVTVEKKDGPKTPFDEFSEYHTEFVHEASHVRQMERAAREAGLDFDKFKRCSALEARFARNTALKDAGEPVDDPLSLEELLELIDCREWMRDDPAVRRFLDAVSSPDAIAADEVDEYAGDLDLLDKIIRLLESQSFGIMIGPVLVALDSGEEQEVVVSQNPDGPPRVRVIEGEDNIEPPEVRRVGGSSRGWGHYRIKIKGRAAGSARIEVICGDKRETVRVTVR